MPKPCLTRKPYVLSRCQPSKRALINVGLVQDLDTALKKACEDLITSTSLRLTASIQSFLDRCTSFLSSPSSTGPRDLPSQDWATSEQVLKLHEEFQEGLEREMKGVSDKMRLYLEEEKTVGVLLPPLLVSSFPSHLLLGRPLMKGFECRRRKSSRLILLSSIVRCDFPLDSLMRNYRKLTIGSFSQSTQSLDPSTDSLQALHWSRPPTSRRSYKEPPSRLS